ncbi:serine/threonine protein kinase [Nonomuraea sp. NN258]|uniref:serine/threonine-protein kinase n=1 Tax=Nonomuraea antri TaxID=2730852 RepID=UPI0015684B41|nr:serine/threonine-protein kinase [Nonomuraea antri]NRQ32213.1 serine/threonine protein kinase [Nonomuraea antri]
MSMQSVEHLGPYRVIRKIGEGGMGVAHLGLDTAGREVAIKVLHPHVAADLKARDRLSREVETMRRVRSRHVAEVLDAELTGGRPYIVTRFAPGRTLEDTVLSQGAFAAHEVIRLARGLCQALVDIHAAGVIHRDLKPANVMIVAGEPLVIDFGIAHLVNAVRLTQTGMFVGTPGYLAPEIIRNSQITQAADVHALASTVFFAATGLPPFGTGTFEAVCFNTMEGRAQLDRAPVWLRGWLSRALQVDPASRPGARELLRMVGELDPDSRVDGRVDTRTAGRADGGERLASGTLTMDVSDLLPPVEYAQKRQEERPPPYVPASVPPYVPASPSHVPAPAPTLRAESPEEPRPAPAPPPEPFDLRRFVRGSGFVGVLLLATLVALTVVMPVVIGLGAAALSLALRAGDHFLFPGERRPLSTTALVVVGNLALALALGIVTGSVLSLAGGLHTNQAESLAAGAFTLGLFVLPGAAAVRRAAAHVLARVLPGGSPIVVSTAVMGPVALIAWIVALLQVL